MRKQVTTGQYLCRGAYQSYYSILDLHNRAVRVREYDKDIQTIQLRDGFNFITTVELQADAEGVFWAVTPIPHIGRPYVLLDQPFVIMCTFYEDL